VVVRDLLVVRFGPFTADGCRKNAEGTYVEDVERGGVQPRFAISVYAIEPAEGEDEAAAITRLCLEVPVGGKSVAVITRADLESEGWRLEMDVPPAHHYLIGQDDFSQMPDIDGLALIWSTCRRANPAWKKS
jgi:hypothetical protein